MEEIMNPVSEKALRPEAAEYVAKLREARRGARKAARSGHPGKRAEGRRAASVEIPELIRRTYVAEAFR